MSACVKPGSLGPERKEGNAAIKMKKDYTYSPGASSWAPSLHEWWLCRQPGPYLIPLAGIAQRQCDP